MSIKWFQKPTRITCKFIHFDSKFKVEKKNAMKINKTNKGMKYLYKNIIKKL